MPTISAAKITKAAPAAKAPAHASDRARAQRRSKLIAFLSDPPRDVLQAAEQLGLAREHYGADTERELADFETGRHVLQRRRANAR